METKNQMDTKLIKIFNLLTNKHSIGLVDRHTYLVNKFVISSKGIHLIDFQLYTDIFWKCQELLAFNNCYEVVLCMLCDILKRPLLKQKASDEEKYAKEVAACFNTLGEIAELSTDLIKSSFSKAIAYMYVTSADTSGDVNVVSSNFIKLAISSSSICTSIVKCLGKVLHIETSCHIILSLFKLSDSSETCNAMLKADMGILLCKFLFEVMMDINNSRSVFNEIGFLWNLFENGNQEEVVRQVCTDFGLSVIHQVFTHQVTHCISISDKQLRNDILIVILYAAAVSSASQVIHSELLKTVSICVSYPEIESRLEFVQNIKIVSSPEDFEFKKQLMISLVLFCKDKACAKILAGYHVVAALFTYIKPIVLPIDSVWSITEFEEMQLQAMAVLSTLVNFTIEEYIGLQGNTRLLLLLEWCVSTAEYNGHGNCFYGQGGRGGKRAQMRFCIRLLRSVCSTENEIVLQDLFDQGAIVQISEILQHCCLSANQKDELDVEMQSDMLFILSILTQDDNHKKELFGESGVKTLLMYLTFYLDQKNNILNFAKLALTTLDCIRACVIGCAINEIAFLENEGAFLLLDILQKCPSLMKTAALGILLDLSENEKTLDHLKLWRGMKENTVEKLLLRFWIAEEQRLGVLRNEHGIIDDIKKPIMTKYQRAASLVDISNASSSIFDVTDNLRAKIYSLFTRIGFKVANLGAQEAIALSVIRRYLDFKALEIWQEIQTELEVENVKLVESDEKCLDVIITKLESKVQLVANNQNKILVKCFEEELSEERHHYKKVRDSQQQDEKSAENFCSFVQRTSDFNCLQRARMKQLDLIEKSALKSKHSLQISDIKDCYVTKHSTVDKRLMTTNFCGRHVIVHSTSLDPTLKPSLDLKNSQIKLPELMN